MSEERPREAAPDQAALVTSTTLLDGLRAADDGTVWRLVLDRYRPLVEAYARKLGLAEPDAEDVAQATLLDFWNAYRGGGYDRARGRLSSWLFGIATNRVRSWRRSAGRADERRGERDAQDALGELAAEDELKKLWERESNDALLWECLRQVRGEVSAETLRAFELFALGERPAEDVARELGMTANAVFQAKRRVLARLRRVLPGLREDW
jgi:RNA polymerase sigma-70 factor (ECF subfamily)